MRLKELLHKTFKNAAANLDKRLHKTLIQATLTLSEFKELSIFGLGRHLESKAKVKHTIKRMDRLFGNKNLHRKRQWYYKTMIQLMIGSQSRPVIIVDWSGLTRCGAYHFLRASVPLGGRALPIWESTYYEREYAAHKVHQQFLVDLKRLLPSHCKPIIITDAGFRCPWFQLIVKMGWDYIGRVRNVTQCCKNDTKHWFPIKSLYGKATTSAKRLFRGYLAKSNPILCDFYLYKERPKKRVRKNLRGKKIQCSMSKKHAKRENEPLLIVTSLNHHDFTAAQMIKLYKKRMQIEEAFRDLKNTKNGFSLRHCRSFSKERLNIALLIGAMAMILLWLLGLMAKMENVAYSYQANSIKHRNVLSCVMIGWQYLKRKRNKFSNQVFVKALQEVQLCDII